ncbi:MAG: hypothetical protein KGI50_01525 [Patescibacteria group bacterium]|nr:hypothetical protein [Patescibacteria group bacterium]MDE2437977.1 hypothetical protein [Patescibacteria group bacterium]
MNSGLFIVLPKEAIEEFKKLYKERYGIELSDEEASYRANNLVNLYKAVYDESSFGRIKVEEKEKR